jgi:hypothetical protein
MLAMAHQKVKAAYVNFGGFDYTAAHWESLRPFLEGDERDPKNSFRLVDDVWEAWRYAVNGRPTEASAYRFRFGHFRSWLKPYVKYYCYARLMGRADGHTTSAASLPYVLTLADAYITKTRCASLDVLAIPAIFEDLWDAQHTEVEKKEGESRKETVLKSSRIQEKTRPFWCFMSSRYGAPQVVPATRRPATSPAEVGRDKSKLIPVAVVRQCVNKLALHRCGISVLNRYHHLRLCVLILLICLGRRIDEVLASHRGAGPDGPLERYPCRHDKGEPETALWFRFSPNKGGPSEWVYISPQWEDIALYCVRELVKYGDEVRQFAAPEERHLLMLVSTWNWTSLNFSRRARIADENQDFRRLGACGGVTRLNCFRKIKKHTTALGYPYFYNWLNGTPNRNSTGVMQEWHITEDGTYDGQIYRMRTHHARHTRQSIISSDPLVSFLTKQRDLNHSDPNMQFAYQHVLDEQNEILMKKVVENPLAGNSADALSDLLDPVEEDSESSKEFNYTPGPIKLITPRWKRLLDNNPNYFQRNQGPLGICEEPEGVENCTTYQENKRRSETNGVKKSQKQIDKSTQHSDETSAVRIKSRHRRKPLELDSITTGNPKDQRPIDSSEIVRRLKKRKRDIEDGKA